MKLSLCLLLVCGIAKSMENNACPLKMLAFDLQTEIAQYFVASYYQQQKKVMQEFLNQQQTVHKNITQPKSGTFIDEKAILRFATPNVKKAKRIYPQKCLLGKKITRKVSGEKKDIDEVALFQWSLCNKQGIFLALKNKWPETWNIGLIHKKDTIPAVDNIFQVGTVLPCHFWQNDLPKEPIFRIHYVPYFKKFLHVAISGSGQVIALANRHQIFVINLKTQKVEKIFDIPITEKIANEVCKEEVLKANFNAIALSYDGTIVGVRFADPYLVEHPGAQAIEFFEWDTQSRPKKLSTLFECMGVCKAWN